MTPVVTKLKIPPTWRYINAHELKVYGDPIFIFPGVIEDRIEQTLENFWPDRSCTLARVKGQRVQNRVIMAKLSQECPSSTHLIDLSFLSILVPKSFRSVNYE